MSAAKKYAMRDLLISSEPRWVVSDKGSTWVTDRYVMVRADLFKQVPKAKFPTWREASRKLSVTALRSVLAQARGTGKPLESTEVAYARGERARMWRAGEVMVFLNERVTRNYYLAGLRPRYVAESGMVAWYGRKRGQQVLMVIQKPVIPFDLEWDQLERVAA